MDKEELKEEQRFRTNIENLEPGGQERTGEDRRGQERTGQGKVLYQSTVHTEVKTSKKASAKLQQNSIEIEPLPSMEEKDSATTTTDTAHIAEKDSATTTTDGDNGSHRRKGLRNHHNRW